MEFSKWSFILDDFILNDKETVKKLKDKLFFDNKNILLLRNEEILDEVNKFAERYKKFIDKAKTEREVVREILRISEKVGFKKFDKSRRYVPGDKVYKVSRDKNIALAIIGEKGAENGFKLIVSHVDSPRLDLKPSPLYEKNELALFKTHYYGGIKKYQWTAIPLALHGRIVLKKGSELDLIIGENEDEPCFCVTDLLPHLAHDQMNKSMNKAINGEDLNILVGGIPFKSDKGSELVKLNILNILNKKYKITEHDFVFAEFEMVPAFKARDVGFDSNFIGAYGHDDRCCAFPAMYAMFETIVQPSTSVAFFVDKEEIGSEGNTGMKSTFLKHFLADLAEISGVKNRQVLSKSKCVSADVNAAFDPNYSENFDPLNSSYVNKGVVLSKYTGFAGKAGASDASAEFLSYMRMVFETDDITWQVGELGKVDNGGGGTIAKYVANLDIDTVDVGIPVLSMHSPFEVISKLDLFELFRALGAFLATY
ncbi:MAG: aminopeptidase [Oscillospiraceae bacterium]|nr:aminopeptidase [Oscillospiraceae bacterium]